MATPPWGIRVVVGHDLRHQRLPGLQFPIRQSHVLNQSATDTVPDSQFDWRRWHSDQLRKLTSELLHNVFAQRAIAFGSRGLEQPSALSRWMLEPVVWMLTLTFKSRDRPVVDRDDWPRGEHAVILPRTTR